MSKKRTSVFRGLIRYILPARTIVLLSAYVLIFWASLFAAYEIRYEFFVPEVWRAARWENLTWVLPLKLLLLFFFGQFGGLLSYFRLPDLYRVFFALTISAMVLAGVWYLAEGRGCPPRSVVAGDYILSLALICSFRVGLRVSRERLGPSTGGGVPPQSRRVAIVGAGDAGAGIAADLLSGRGYGMRPVVFLDDNPRKWKKHIHGISVVDSPDNLDAVSRKFGIEEIIIAMPSAPVRRIREVVQAAQGLGIKAEIVPSLMEITTGRVRANRMRPVDIEDLLGRDPVQLESDQIREFLEGRVVAVTGAGGSIGRELCRQIAYNDPGRLLLVEQSELQLFEAEQELIEHGYEALIVPLVADIVDEARMTSILKTYRPQVVFHAAAHKHVHMMERQPGEAIKNNTLGSAGLFDLLSAHAVEHVVFVSTDKAINPTSVMGASKRLAEVYLQAKHAAPENRTRFMAVRFGNVLGSSGSVVPIFRRQIAQGGPVTVTHQDATRFFMTVPEAVGLVLQSATQGNGGEIFVLDMGEPVRIVDLARQMIELSGFRPDVDIEIRFTGLLPGEKLYEEIQHSVETYAPTRHPRIMRFICEPHPLNEVEPMMRRLRAACAQGTPDSLKELLREFLPEYAPPDAPAAKA